jgi:hypothetical protein
LNQNNGYESFRKAMLAACKYMCSKRFGLFTSHGRHGKKRTEEYVRTLLQQSDPTEKFIKQAMQNWLKKDNDSKEASTNTNCSSRARYAYEADLLITSTTPGLFSEKNNRKQAERNQALFQMLNADCGS